MRPAVYIPVMRDRSHHLRHTLDRLRVAPEELAGLRINSDYALAQKLHVLFPPARLNDDRRRISRMVATRDRRFPYDRARLFVKRHDCGLGAAGGYDYDVTIHQRGLCISPCARLAAE